MSSHPPILIVGAGPAGLVAANMLWQHGIDVTVLEADASLSSKDQGGTLDLHRMKGNWRYEKQVCWNAFLLFPGMTIRSKELSTP